MDKCFYNITQFISIKIIIECIYEYPAPKPMNPNPKEEINEAAWFLHNLYIQNPNASWQMILLTRLKWRLWSSRHLFSSNPIPRKSWWEPQALEYHFHLGICTPYADAVGMLLHINWIESLQWENLLFHPKLSFLTALPLSVAKCSLQHLKFKMVKGSVISNDWSDSCFWLDLH